MLISLQYYMCYLFFEDFTHLYEMGSNHIYSLIPHPVSSQHSPPPSLEFVFPLRFPPLYKPLSPVVAAGMHKAVQTIHWSRDQHKRTQ